MLTIIIANRYPDIIQPLLESIGADASHPETEIVIVSDGHQDSFGYHGVVYDLPTWQYSVGVNMGIRYSVERWPKNDIILINDDCKLYNKFDMLDLHIIGREMGPVGILSPLIRGCVGNPVQRYHEKGKHWRHGETLKLVWNPDPVCFPCVWLRSAMLNRVGLLNETIKGYGFEDDEYCYRARGDGWITAVTPLVVVQHGDGERDLTRGKTWSTSYARRDAE